MTVTRRDLIKLAAALGGAYATGCTHARARSDRNVGFSPATEGAVDYTRAKARPTICFGCTTHCGVIGWVQDGRVRKIEGNPLDPNTQGAICSKANGMLAYTYYPERLLYPLIRVGPRGSGRWRRITWNEALDEIAARLRPLREEGRPEELVFHYGRDKTKGFTKRFTEAFGTPHRLNRRSICSSNRRVPLMSFYGREFEWESQDFEHTSYIVNFGGNPMEAYQGGLYMVRRIMNARVDRGAKMITFEVRPSAIASVSDEFYPVKPASDGMIALAMAHVILREGLEDKAFWDRWANYPLEKLRTHLAPYTPTGSVQIVRSTGGRLLVRLGDDFAQEVGPGDTQLILARSGDNVQAQRDADPSSTSPSIGTIPNGARGTREFEIPSGVDLDDFDYVIVYCAPAGVNFGAAKLPLRAGSLAGDGAGGTPDASGDVALARDLNGDLVVQLADAFMQEAGPGDTQLILARTADNVQAQRNRDPNAASASLGTIPNGGSGARAFAVPQNVDVDLYDYAIVWCPTAGVNFGVARLQ